MKQIPLISVVMSIYCEPIQWISQAIDSILNQSFSDLEFVIVNDNPSRLENYLLLDKYQKADGRVHIIHNAMNLGLTCSLNIAIKATNGRYIARMDADDVSLPERLETQYLFLEKKRDVVICGSWGYLFKNMHVSFCGIKRTPCNDQEVAVFSLFANPIIHSSVMIRKEFLEQEAYDVKFKKAQDYVLWGRAICENRSIYNIPVPLIKYRISSMQISSNFTNEQCITANEVRKRLLQRLLPVVTMSEVNLHNQICNLQCLDGYNILHVEKWLCRMKELLVKFYPLNEQYICTLISSYWVNSCIRGGQINRCLKSVLCKMPLYVILLKYVKYKMRYLN
ncbi:glycosyltransferase [Bacteroides oleiciplenus]|uniref:Glycosyltransferase n=1 Tax=Bacteroides oleiciplenus TaxID=626931 RepID=A0A3E5B180_9BACE|nr:glycosyltransferase [Bacteroides oleiciplenus]RGN31224.1 glycosyltransferase [Bacteroides oleiciplenus]